MKKRLSSLSTVSAAVILLAGCADMGSFSPFSGKESDVATQEAAPAVDPYERDVAMADGIAVPQPKPPEAPPVSALGDAPLVPEAASPEMDLAEARYVRDGMITPSAKPAPPVEITKISRDYKEFRSELIELSKAAINTPSSMESAGKRLAAHDPELLAEGWIAYTAEAVANDPAFEKALSKRLDKNGRRQILARIEEKPGYIASLSDFKKVKPVVLSLITEEVGLMKSLGDIFHKQALAFQGSRWGQADPLTPLATPAAWDPSLTIDRFNRALVWQAADPAKTARAHTPTLPPARAKASMAPMMGRILDLAARINLQAADGKNQPAVARLMSNKGMAQCFTWARLNLAQCTAAAGRPSELAYCTAKHALQERANCWDWLISFDRGA